MNTSKKEKMKIPIGVSQWFNYGKKYGYDKFFEDKIRQSQLDRIIKMIEDKYPNYKEDFHNEVEEILSLLTNLSRK